MAKDLYAVLGLSKDASPEDIKKAYRAKSKEFHPDKHKGEKAAEDKFKEINEAYEVLSNPEKKRGYDQFGSTGGPGGGFGGGGAGFNGQGFDFSSFGGASDLGDMFESFFGGGRGRAARQQGGDDREVEMTIDLMDVVHGARKDVKVQSMVKCKTCDGKGAEPGTEIAQCPRCNGTGAVTQNVQSFFGSIQRQMVCDTCEGSGKVPKTPCHTCSGEGRVRENSDVIIEVPAGIEHGQTLKLRGQADAGRQGAPAGDLFVHIRVRPDKRFTREGPDIRSTITVPAIDAILGAEADVETVHGSSTVQIPDGMQPGQTFRIRGQGLPILGSSKMGDHYVTVSVEIPKKLSRAERKLMEEWRTING